jgi:hypothetical protein
MTQYTDDDGDAVATKDATHIYGPYLKRATLPTDPYKQIATLVVSSTGTLPLTADAGDPGGWKFDTVSGQFVINHTAYDDR